MTTDFRTLCAELLLALEGEGYTHWTHSPDEDDLVLRARAALADAAPESRKPASVVGNPTDEELLTLLPQSGESGFWLPKRLPSDWVDSDFIAPPEAIVAFARAVLTRWGNPAPQVNPWKETLIDALVCNFLLNTENKDNPKKALNDLIAWEKQLATDPLINPELQPVPVNERLPGPKDCDEEGRCWWWQPSHPEGGYLEGWMLRPRFWGVGHYDLDDRLTHTHWLPAHALPLPTAND